MSQLFAIFAYSDAVAGAITTIAAIASIDSIAVISVTMTIISVTMAIIAVSVSVSVIVGLLDDNNFLPSTTT